MATQDGSQLSFVGTAPVPPPGESPAPAAPPQNTYKNADGQFDVDRQYARGIYHFPLDNSFNDDYFQFSKPLIFNLPEGTILALVYDVLTPGSTFSVAFSLTPLSFAGGQHYPLLYSFDGVNYSLWLTTTGTSREPLANPVHPPQQTTTTSPTTPNPTTTTSTTPTTPTPTGTTPNPTTTFHGGGPEIIHGDFSSDGLKTKYPIHREQDADHGSAKLDIDETGTFSLTLSGTHSGISGQTDLTAVVVVTGFRNGQPHIVLNQPKSCNLTISADSFTGTSSKSKTFISPDDLPPIASVDIDHVRNVRVLLGENVSGQNFVDVISSAIGAASTLLSEADALYKQWNDSDIGQSVDTDAAAG